MPDWNIFKKLAEFDGAGDDQPSVELEVAPEPSYAKLLDRGSLDIARVVQPEALSWEEDWCKVGDEYTCSFYIHTYPSQVDDAWLHPLLHFEHPLDASIYIQPLPIDQFLRRRQNELAQEKGQIEQAIEEQRRPNAKKIRKVRDTQHLLDAIENEDTQPYHIIIVLTLRSASEDGLKKASQELMSRMISIQLRRVKHRHLHGFQTTAPLMNNELIDTDNVRFMHTQGLMALFPFTSSDLTHETGVLMGLSRSTRSPIIVNRFFQPPAGNLETANSAIFGMSGSGKSFFAKGEMTRYTYKGIGVIVLDPSGEYARVCSALGGHNVTISLDSQDRINPLDFSYAVEPGRNALRNKIAAMSDLLRVMLRSGPDKTEVDSIAKTIFDNALIETYRRFGYLVADESTQQNATPQNMPRLRDVYKMLARIGRSDRRQMVQERVERLLAGLARFVDDGPLAGLFDNHSTVDLKGSHFVNFNLAAVTQMSHEYVPMAMQLVLEYLRTVLFTDAQQSGRLGKKLLYVDEAQHLMAFDETARFLHGAARTVRKYGVGLTVMTQDVGVFVLGDDGGENKIGRAILANCSTTVLLKQHPNELGAVQRAFNLTPAEVAKLSSSGVGEGLIIVGQDSAWFSARGMAHPAEQRLFETSVDARRAYAEEDARRELQQQGGGFALPPGAFENPRELPAARRELPAPDGGLPAPTDTGQFEDPFGGAEGDPFGDAQGPFGDGDNGPFTPLT